MYVSLIFQVIRRGTAVALSWHSYALRHTRLRNTHLIISNTIVFFSSIKQLNQVRIIILELRQKIYIRI